MNNQEQNIINNEILEQHKDITKQKQEPEVNCEEINNIDFFNKRISELENTLIQTQQNERDNILRAKAEVENIRRRSEQEISKAHKFALERFINNLLPVIDNLERTLSLSDKPHIELSSIIEGIQLTHKSLLDTVYKFGLSAINDINVPFNPDLHQAMSTSETEEHKPNHVIAVMQKGYILNGRLIRPAMVTVSKNKSSV